MAKRTTAVQRTMRLLRGQGSICAVVEKYNAFVGEHGIRQDLFGIVDVLCLDPERGFVGVQCCTGSFAEHWRKMTEDCAQACYDWLTTPGGHLEIWTWRKLKKVRGGKAFIWQPRVDAVRLEDLPGKEKE